VRRFDPSRGHSFRFARFAFRPLGKLAGYAGSRQRRRTAVAALVYRSGRPRQMPVIGAASNDSPSGGRLQASSIVRRRP
jgi:hypothetical protein